MRLCGARRGRAVVMTTWRRSAGTARRAVTMPSMHGLPERARIGISTSDTPACRTVFMPTVGRQPAPTACRTVTLLCVVKGLR